MSAGIASEAPVIDAPSTLPDTRVYAVGDIHGRADLLAVLLARIEADAASAPAARCTVVFLGDYIDRGPQSREVLDRLLAGPPAGCHAVYLKGNHEAFMEAFLDDASLGPEWLFNGGAATLHSYGVDVTAVLGFDLQEAEMERLRQDLLSALPGAHRRFLADMALWHAEGDYLFVHAGLRPGVPVEKQTERDLMWIREPFLTTDQRFDKVVVHGHSIEMAPVVRHNRIGIDTGAYASGVLTCLVLEGTGRRFLQTG